MRRARYDAFHMYDQSPEYQADLAKHEAKQSLLETSIVLGVLVAMGLFFVLAIFVPPLNNALTNPTAAFEAVSGAVFIAVIVLVSALYRWSARQQKRSDAEFWARHPDARRAPPRWWRT
jgi:hypothetical protein